MAVMDEFKEERAALKNAGFKKKAGYFWYYYKWYVICSICAIVLIGSLVHDFVNRRETAFYTVMLNVIPLNTDSAEYADAFADYAEIDTSSEDIIFNTSLRISEDGISEDSYYSSQQLAVYVSAAELDTMLTDAASFRKYANSYYFYDLRDILTAKQLEMYEPYFYYVDQTVVEQIDEAADNLDTAFQPNYPDPRKPEEMEQPIPVGIYLNGNEELLKNFYFQQDDIVIGIYANTKHLDTALSFLDFLQNN